MIGLFIVATPIGNLDDISKRAIRVISEADIVICENPKHSLKLLNKLGIKKKLISLHDYNENKVIEKLTENLLSKKIVLISDAGSPLISDPGYKLVKYCIDNNINIVSIPGPASIIPALQLSGIPVNTFYFGGFFPKMKKQMLEYIKYIADCEKTSVFFVSSHKLHACLELLEIYLKKRSVSISKELTKINEKVFWGLASEIKNKIIVNKQNLKGEFVVVVEGKSLTKNDPNNLVKYNKEIKVLLSKFSLTDVVEIVHNLTGISKNKIYKWTLKLKKG